MDRFPSAIQRELMLARMAAARERAPELRPGHLLLGLIASSHTLVGRALKWVPIEQARAALSSVPPGDGVAGQPSVPDSAETEALLRRASGEASALGQTLTAEYLLLALFEDEACARVLAMAGLNEKALRESLRERASTPPRFEVGPSPDPALDVAPYRPAMHPEFTWVLTQQPFARLSTFAAVVANRSPLRVTALVARWTRTEADSVVKTSDVVVDDYFVYNRFTALGSGHSVLVMPGGVTPPFQAGDGWAWAGPMDTDDSGAVAMSLALDSVVFEDGRIAGADAYDIGRHLHERHAAAVALAGQVLAAEQAGERPEAVIARLLDTGGAAPDRRGWPWRLGMSARHAPEWLRRIPDLPAPPRFWRQEV